MTKNQITKRRAFIIIIGIITILAVYLVLKGDKPVNQTIDNTTITNN